MTCRFFSLELVAAAAPETRCRHLGQDDAGPFCDHIRATIPGPAGESASRNACDSASLQLWCLAGSQRWAKCHFHPEWSDA